MRHLQRGVSTVSPAVVAFTLELPDTYSVTLRGQGPDNRLVRLSSEIGLGVAAWYRLVESPGERTWAARVVAHYYDLYDRDGHEIISYHWHPQARSHVTTPHLHLGGGVAAWRPDLTKAHLPTGYVTLEDVLMLAIGDLGVVPRRGDWRIILTSAEAP